MAGIRLGKNAKALFFGVVPADASAVVVTVAGHSTALPGTDAGQAKVTPLDEYPPKGRGTGGVRCHRFLKGEDTLLIAWAGAGPARAAAATGVPVDLPEPDMRRDGSGVPLPQPIAAVSGPPYPTRP
jgi:DNA gyrase subunit A